MNFLQSNPCLVNSNGCIFFGLPTDGRAETEAANCS